MAPSQITMPTAKVSQNSRWQPLHSDRRRTMATMTRAAAHTSAVLPKTASA